MRSRHITKQVNTRVLNTSHGEVSGAFSFVLFATVLGVIFTGTVGGLWLVLPARRRLLLLLFATVKPPTLSNTCKSSNILVKMK